MKRYQCLWLLMINEIWNVSAGCPDHWMRFSNKCYLFVTRYPLEWIDAMTFCKTNGAKLAEVKSSSENYFLQHEARRLKGSFWLGGSDIIMEGVWKWMDSNKRFYYSAWPRGQPDNYRGREHCLHFFGGYHYVWNDTECNRRSNFICEKAI
ncbi:galactose-specific lectin nattectin-like [Saccostrea cucullata]|uniref:galactose-specific lectin nattectin-like n=1 Tax=Saccostrea cuccullata TaxID=36930 RepID=UPI002ED158E0